MAGLDLFGIYLEIIKGLNGHLFGYQTQCGYSYLFSVFSVIQALRQSTEVDPCQHGMAYDWVGGGGDGLHMWKVAANILNR